jgi:hypothetical protein
VRRGVHVCAHHRRWGLYKLYSVERTSFQPLNLKCDILVSKFTFKFNLYRYTSARCTAGATAGKGGWAWVTGRTRGCPGGSKGR